MARNQKDWAWCGSTPSWPLRCFPMFNTAEVNGMMIHRWWLRGEEPLSSQHVAPESRSSGPGGSRRSSLMHDALSFSLHLYTIMSHSFMLRTSQVFLLHPLAGDCGRTCCQYHCYHCYNGHRGRRPPTVNQVLPCQCHQVLAHGGTCRVSIRY